jgi:N-dimethylarginine dimethylaminohydrolase
MAELLGDPPSELPWGRRFLMCPPDYFDVSYEINHWMDTEIKVDRDRATWQWADLVETLEEAGATVETVSPRPGLPDMVFTANAGIIDGTTYLPAAMRHPQRQPEIPHVREWFARRGWTIAERPVRMQEGAGDALPFGGALVAGYGMRSMFESYRELSERAGWTVVPVRLNDPRFYHVDITFCPLDERTALVVPEAFDSRDLETLTRLVPDLVPVTGKEGELFIANSVVVGRVVIMPACTTRLGRQLEKRGFDVVVIDVSEFMKAGGGPRCLTLALDVDIAGTAPRTGEVAA